MRWMRYTRRGRLTGRLSLRFPHTRITLALYAGCPAAFFAAPSRRCGFGGGPGSAARARAARRSMIEHDRGEGVGRANRSWSSPRRSAGFGGAARTHEAADVACCLLAHLLLRAAALDSAPRVVCEHDAARVTGPRAPCAVVCLEGLLSELRERVGASTRAALETAVAAVGVASRTAHVRCGMTIAEICIGKADHHQGFRKRRGRQKATVRARPCASEGG